MKFDLPLLRQVKLRSELTKKAGACIIMDEQPPRSLGAAANVVAWIRAEATLDGRLRRIREYLANEGYTLPDPPRRVARSEAGATHLVRGPPVTERYPGVDPGRRKGYHYRED